MAARTVANLDSVSLEKIGSVGQDLAKWIRANIPTWLRRYNDFLGEFARDTEYPKNYPQFHPWEMVRDRALRRITAFKDVVLWGDWSDDDDQAFLKERLLNIVDRLHDAADAGLSECRGGYPPDGIHRSFLEALESAVFETRDLDFARFLDEYDDEDAPEERDDRTPYTSADLAALRDMTPCPTDVPTEDEYREHLSEVAMSFDDFAAGKNLPIPTTTLKVESTFVEPPPDGPSIAYGGSYCEIHSVSYSTSDGGRKSLDLRECRKLESDGPDGGPRTVYLTPDDRWVVQLGEFTEDLVPSFVEIAAGSGITRTNQIVVKANTALVTDIDEKGRSQSAISADTSNGRLPPAKKRGRSPRSKAKQKIAEVVMLVAGDPDKTWTEIGAEAGICGGHANRLGRQARERARQRNKGVIPEGTKSRDGRLEATDQRLRNFG